MKRGLVGAIVVASVLVLLGCAAPMRAEQPVEPKPVDRDTFHGAWLDRPYPMPDVTLTDTSGLAYNLRTSPTTPVTLLYFGYMDCPNICLNTLADLAGALKRVPSDVRDDVTVVVVDIHPGARSGADFRHWLDRFDPAFVGVRGPDPLVQRVADSMGVEIHATHDSDTVLHGAQVIAFDRRHDGVLLWTPGMPLDHVAADVRALVAQQR